MIVIAILQEIQSVLMNQHLLQIHIYSIQKEKKKKMMKIKKKKKKKMKMKKILTYQ